MLVTFEVQTHETSLPLLTLVLRVCSSTTIYCLPFITAVSDTLAVGHLTVTPLLSKYIGDILNVRDVFCETAILDRSVPETVAVISSPVCELFTVHGKIQVLLDTLSPGTA